MNPAEARERHDLLKQAAAAIELEYATLHGIVQLYVGKPNYATVWNPLEFDGDAERLRKTLELDIATGEDWARASDRDGNYVVVETGGTAAAKRRAIVRCAALVGKQQGNKRRCS